MHDIEVALSENLRGAQRISGNDDLTDLPVVDRIIAARVVDQGEVKPAVIEVESCVENLLEVMARTGFPVVQRLREYGNARTKNIAFHAAHDMHVSQSAATFSRSKWKKLTQSLQSINSDLIH